MSYITFDSVYKEYHLGTNIISASDGISFEIEKGEVCCDPWSQRAGKHCAQSVGAMDHVTRGHIYVDGRDNANTMRNLTAYRREAIGFVFQFYNLIRHLLLLKMYLSF